MKSFRPELGLLALVTQIFPIVSSGTLSNGPRLPRTWIFLGGSLFRPFERCPYDLAPLASERVQGTATIQCEGRLLGRSLRVNTPNRNAAQHRSSRNCEPPELDHF